MKTDIIDQLRKAIDDSGESQLAIAKAAGIGQSGLNRFMNGDRGISLETAAKLCNHLKLKLAKAR